MGPMLVPGAKPNIPVTPIKAPEKKPDDKKVEGQSPEVAKTDGEPKPEEGKKPDEHHGEEHHGPKLYGALTLGGKFPGFHDINGAFNGRLGLETGYAKGGHLTAYGTLGVDGSKDGFTPTLGLGVHTDYVFGKDHKSGFLTEGSFHLSGPLANGHGHGLHIGGEGGAGYRTFLDGGNMRLTVAGGGGLSGSTGTGDLNAVPYGRVELRLNEKGKVKTSFELRGDVNIPLSGGGHGGHPPGPTFVPGAGVKLEF